MMRFTWKDIVAAALLAAVVVPYVGYLVKGEMPYIHDPRGMAITGIVFGVAATLLARRPAARERGTFVRIAVVLAATALATGLAALWTGNEVLLAMFIGLMVATWVLDTLTRANALRTNHHEVGTPNHA